MNFASKRCLVIPDIHQNIAWVNDVLAGETECDRVVFLGDFFDSSLPRKRRTGVGATCTWLNETLHKLGNRAVFLLGNHDVQYLEAKPACDRHRTPRHLGTKCGSAFTHSAAKRIAHDLDPEFWRKARLFVCVNGWLLSHAGLATVYWPSSTEPESSLTQLEDACQTALQTLSPHRLPHPLLQAGRVRGGDAPVGGITWLDWNDEFDDGLPLPQIVGHTGSSAGARQRGRSWCLDGHQTCYGILTASGLLIKNQPPTQ